jgi:hypothetical protein
MSPVVIVWSSVAAVAATLGCIHVAVWASDRKALANLMFSLSAFAVAAIAGWELTLMHTDSIARFGAVIRWGQIPVLVLQVGIVMFVALHFGTGRRWLLCGYGGATYHGTTGGGASYGGAVYHTGGYGAYHYGGSYATGFGAAVYHPPVAAVGVAVAPAPVIYPAYAPVPIAAVAPVYHPFAPYAAGFYRRPFLR